jgi:hypothetical protein
MCAIGKTHAMRSPDFDLGSIIDYKIISIYTRPSVEMKNIRIMRGGLTRECCILGARPK